MKFMHVDIAPMTVELREMISGVEDHLAEAPIGEKVNYDCVMESEETCDCPACKKDRRII